MAGERFMERYHRLKELAPRDVVSRSIVLECRATGETNVFLDLTHLPAGFARERFPRIYKTCLMYGVDLEKNLAPVRPAAHYEMGGIKTDLAGRASLPRLFAAGEAACTGVHGANRLASNSLLEGVVFGARAGKVMRELAAPNVNPLALEPPPPPRFPSMSERDVRAIAWNSCGVIRSGPELEAALNLLRSRDRLPLPNASRGDFERRNMHLVALLIAFAALARKESRGGHYRTDFPEKSIEYRRQSLITRSPVSGELEIRFA
jgi:L-aspartate oxidase